MQNRTFIHQLIFSSKDLFLVMAVLPDLQASTMEMSHCIPPPSQFCTCSPDAPLSAPILRATAHTWAGTAVVQATLSKFSMEPSVGCLPQHGLKLLRMVLANSIYSPPTWHLALCLKTSEPINVKRTSKQIAVFTSNK